MEQGDVYWVSMNPTRGYEIQGKGKDRLRPCVILSPNVLNETLKTLIIAPCTSQIKTPVPPYRVRLSSLEKEGLAVLDQIRSIDRERLARPMGKVTKKELSACLKILQKIFQLRS